jgi:chromosome partitioning protein
MVPAKGLGWPDQPGQSAAPTPEPGGLHRGHSEPEGPELADGPRPDLTDGPQGGSAAGPQAGAAGPLSEVDGLGWPQNFSNDAVLGSQPLSRAATQGASAAGMPGAAQPPKDTDPSGQASHAPVPRPPAPPSPARVQQALAAAVSRGTAALSTDAVRVSGPIGNGLEDAMPGGTAAQDDGSAGGVVIPDVPQNPRDTPIARAAEAAVGVRGAGDGGQWPHPANCRIMTIANQKGGVGKTTTAVNLAASLSQHGVRVLVIDLDPQGNASTALDVDHRVGTPSVYNTLVEDRPLADIVKPVEGLPGLYCAPATIDLAGAEIELVPLVARESRLARAVAAYDSSNLDYILIDCPPSLGLLTLNALVAAREVLIPIQCEYYALEGLEQLLRTVDLVKGHLNQDLQISTILLTMYDGRTRLASQVADDVRSHFGDVVLQSIIPRSVRVSEAPSYGQSVITYDPGSSGSLAYVEAARELSQRHPQMAS